MKPRVPVRLNGRRGFTLLEMMFACLLMTIVMAGVFQSVLAVMGNDRRSSMEAELYLAANKAVERVQRGSDGLAGLMKSREDSVTIGAAGDSITFSVDENDPYTSDPADDTTMSVYVVDVDGVPGTTNDNTLMLDPDTAVVGDEIELCVGVFDLEFIKDERLVTMRVEIERTVRGLPLRVNAQQDIYVRN